MSKPGRIIVRKKPKQHDEAVDSTLQFEKLLQRTSGIEHYSLRLYVTGTTARSSQAISNIRALCEEYLKDRYDLEVIDIYQKPTEAIGEQIIAAPTLVKRLPMPQKRMVGNFSDPEKILVGLELKTKRSGEEFK